MKKYIDTKQHTLGCIQKGNNIIQSLILIQRHYNDVYFGTNDSQTGHVGSTHYTYNNIQAYLFSFGSISLDLCLATSLAILLALFF